MIARTASGAAVRLGDEVARGGEAVIRTVVGDSRLEQVASNTVMKVGSNSSDSVVSSNSASCRAPRPDPGRISTCMARKRSRSQAWSDSCSMLKPGW